MIFSIIGLPGSFAEACDRIVLELARRRFGQIELIEANTLQEIALAAMGRGLSRAIVAARQPSGGLRAALAESGGKVVMALDDPQRALLELVLGRELPLPDAVAAVASSCAAILGSAALPGALRLRGERDRLHLRAVASAISRHLGLDIGESEAAELVQSLGLEDGSVLPLDPLNWWSGLTTAERAMVEGALRPYLGYFETGELGAITWTHALFFLGEHPAERATGPIDITGRARCVLEGPWIALPPGSWSLSLALQISREAAEHEFVAEVATDVPLASGTIRPRPDGPAEIHLDFVLPEFADHPISLKLSTRRAAFDGAIALLGATLTRAGAPRPLSDRQPGDPSSG